MAVRKRNPNPPTQEEILTGKQIETPKIGERAQHIRRDDDTTSNYNVGLIDIDKAIIYYFDHVIVPRVKVDDEYKNVPVMYGSPERWSSAQKQGFIKDQQGTILIPLIMFKRTGVSKRRDLSRIMDANNPRLTYSFRKSYTPKNNYDQFSVITNAIPQYEYHNIVIPDYVTLTYDCIIWTDYVEQSNKLIEAISYAEGSYWGDPERFKFYAYINDFDSDIDYNQTEDRTVKVNFKLTLSGYIVADALQKEIAQKSQKSFSMSQIKFGTEITTDGNIINDQLPAKKLYDYDDDYGTDYLAE